MRKTSAHLLSLLIVLLVGCKAYRQDIMFQLDEDFDTQDLSTAVDQAEGNYKLRAGDKLELTVFTNDGERLVDPNFELSSNMGNNQQAMQLREGVWYLVQDDGMAKFPMVGKIDLLGLTIDEAESVLQQAYDESYVDSFVKLKVINRRVVVLGAGGGMVVPMDNENTSLLEVLAIYGGVDMESKVKNVRLIRGDLKSPEVYQMDLSTISGMQQSVMGIEAGDVIYVEPWRRPWRESIKDIAPVISLLSSTVTIIIVILKL